MRRLWILVGVGFVAVLQTTLVPELRTPRFGVAPDLLLAVACLCGLYAAPWDAVAVAWCCGFAKDLLSPSTPGLHAFLFAACAFFLVRTRLGLFRDHPLTQALVVGVCTVLCESVTGFGTVVTRGGSGVVSDGGTILMHAGTAAFYGAVLAPFVFPVAANWPDMGRGLLRRLRLGR